MSQEPKQGDVEELSLTKLLQKIDELKVQRATLLIQHEEAITKIDTAILAFRKAAKKLI